MEAKYDICIPKVPRIIPTWLGFARVELYPTRDDILSFVGTPQLPFKGRGLMFFDVPRDATLDAVLVGTNAEVLVSYEGIPARIFSRAHSLEEMRRRTELGEEEFNTWMELSVCEPGHLIRLNLTSQTPNGFMFTQAAMWGHTVY